MASKAEVVILGGGVAGCTTAYHLGKKGISSVILEKDAIASQASGKAWAVSISAQSALMYEVETMPPQCMRPAMHLYEEGYRRFPQLAQELKEEGRIDIEYGTLPALALVFREKGELQLKERLAELKSEGLEASWLGRDEVIALNLGVNPGVRGALLYPGGQVEPYQYVLSLAQAAEAKGATIRQGQAVGFRHDKSRVTSVVLASGTELGGDAFVIAMGPWSKFAASWLGMELPLRPIREQCLRVEVPRRLPPYALYSSRVTIIPKVNGTVVVGLSGKEEPAELDAGPTDEARVRLTEAAVGLVPRLKEARLMEHRAGVVGWTPNALPIVGRLPGWDNVYIATGFTAGISLSPAVGRNMAELITTEKAIEALSPARFG